jgi:hypothetical protein
MEAALLTSGAALEASSAALAWSLEGFAVILKAAEAVLHTALLPHSRYTPQYIAHTSISRVSQYIA